MRRFRNELKESEAQIYTSDDLIVFKSDSPGKYIIIYVEYVYFIIIMNSISYYKGNYSCAHIVMHYYYYSEIIVNNY